MRQEIEAEVEMIGKQLGYKGCNEDVIVAEDEDGVGSRQLLFEKESELNGIVWVEQSLEDVANKEIYSRKFS